MVYTIVQTSVGSDSLGLAEREIGLVTTVILETQAILLRKVIHSAAFPLKHAHGHLKRLRVLFFCVTAFYS
jgi:hypothetical protein